MAEQQIGRASQDTADARRVAVVTTTIRVPEFLEPLIDAARRAGQLPRLEVIVVGDRRTPAATQTYLADLARRAEVDVRYLGPGEQTALLRPFPALEMLLRWDCVQRRNVGWLQAAIDRADVIVSIDDDNHPLDDGFLAAHQIVGRRVELPVVSHPSGWWNVGERFVCEPPRRFYLRGFPKSRQDWRFGGARVERRVVKVAVNAGLWLGTPDVDATAQIEQPIDATRVEPVDGDDRCALAPGTWCPINTQNTAFDAALLPAMYLPVMLEPVHGYRIDRADDIWMGYFLRTIADQRGESVVYGPPWVRQRRNPHDHLADLEHELPTYRLTERLAGYLREFRAAAPDYHDAYGQLIRYLRRAYDADASLPEGERECFRQLTIGMAIWHETIGRVLGRTAEWPEERRDGADARTA